MSKSLPVVPAFPGDNWGQIWAVLFLLMIHWRSPSTILWGTSLLERFSQGKEEKKEMEKKKKMEKKGKKKEMEEKKEMDKKMQRRKRVPCSKTANLAISSFLISTSRQQESAEDSRDEKSWKNLATPPIQTLSKMLWHSKSRGKLSKAAKAKPVWKLSFATAVRTRTEIQEKCLAPGDLWVLVHTTGWFLIFFFSNRCEIFQLGTKSLSFVVILS